MKSFSASEGRSRLLHSFIPAVPVPFTASGEIDLDAQQRYIRKYMAKQPIAGVAVWAHTGRGLRLKREQRIQVIRAWSDGLGLQKFIVAGVGGSSERGSQFAAYLASAREMARDAVENGARILMVHPPRLSQHGEDAEAMILDYHRQLAKQGAPLILFYLYEEAGGIAYSPALLRRLLALPEVVGIKLATLDSVMTFQNIAELMKEFPHKILITGEDRFLGYSLMIGARAALVGMGAACTSLQYYLMRAYFWNRLARFHELSARVDRLSRVTFVAPMEGYIRRMLWALVHLDVIGRDSAHDPWGPELPESEFTELGKTLRALGEVEARAKGRDTKLRADRIRIRPAL